MERETLASLGEETVAHFDADSLSTAPTESAYASRVENGNSSGEKIALLPLGDGEKGLGQPNDYWHSHFYLDPNCIALAALDKPAPVILAQILPSVWRQPLFPSLSPFPPQARGPPSLPSVSFASNSRHGETSKLRA
jgi:hypothetical protein